MRLGSTGSGCVGFLFLTLAGCGGPQYAFTRFGRVSTVSEPSVAPVFEAHALRFHAGTSAAFAVTPVGSDGSVLLDDSGGVANEELADATGDAPVIELATTNEGRYVVSALRPGAAVLAVRVAGVVVENLPVRVVAQ